MPDADKMLEWETKRFPELETYREGHVVHARPEQVVEVALDGVQRSSCYWGGVVLRFARVKGYRDDKTANEADTIVTVKAIFGGWAMALTYTRPPPKCRARRYGLAEFIDW